MSEKQQLSRTKTPGSKISILLVDAISERRALRKKIMALRGVEVIGANDLAEASSIWHRDRYDMVLVDIRSDHRGCVAFRDEIKKESPHQIVAFLVGKPKFVDLEPSLGSYVAEEHGVEWGDSLRKAVRESCGSLSQRNSFVEASWRIAAGRRINGNTQHAAEPLPPATEAEAPATTPIDTIFVPHDVSGEADGLSRISERLA
jgi:CheY-like chemotaxis protein